MSSASTSLPWQHADAETSNCETEKDCWRVLVHVCDLNRQDIDALMNKMEYNTMKRIAMFGLHKNVQSLLTAGFSDAKANMIVVFATYVLHQPKQQQSSKHHHHRPKQMICIPKNLTFDDVMDVNSNLVNPQQQVPQQPRMAKQMPPLMPHSQQPAHTSPFLIPTTGAAASEPIHISVNSMQKSNSSLSLHSVGSRKSQQSHTSQQSHRSHKSQQSTGKNSLSFHRSNRRIANRILNVDSSEQLDGIDEASFKSARSSPNSPKPPKQRLPKCRSFDSATTAKTAMSCSSRWESDVTQMVISAPGDIGVVQEEDSDTEVEKMVPPPSLLGTVASTGTLGTTRSQSPCRQPARRPSLAPGDHDWKKPAATISANREKGDSIPSCPPRCPAARSSMRWAMALDDANGVDEDLTDSEFEDDSDDDESDSDSDSDDSDDDDESDDSDSDSDSEDEDEELMANLRQHQQRGRPKPASGAAAITVPDNVGEIRWKTHNVVTHEWTLPANQVLPISLQSLFHEAAANPEVDIQRRLQEALMGMGGGVASH